MPTSATDLPAELAERLRLIADELDTLTGRLPANVVLEVSLHVYDPAASDADRIDTTNRLVFVLTGGPGETYQTRQDWHHGTALDENTHWTGTEISVFTALTDPIPAVTR